MPKLWNSSSLPDIYLRTHDTQLRFAFVDVDRSEPSWPPLASSMMMRMTTSLGKRANASSFFGGPRGPLTMDSDLLFTPETCALMGGITSRTCGVARVLRARVLWTFFHFRTTVSSVPVQITNLHVTNERILFFPR